MYPFERFTEDGKRTLMLAQEEAERSHHSYIGTEHLLLGLVRDWAATGTGMLPALGISPEDARDKVLELLRGYARQEQAQLAAGPDAVEGELTILRAAVGMPWRTGRHLGRTIYARLGESTSDADLYIGTMDTRELAEAACEAHNQAIRSADARTP